MPALELLKVDKWTPPIRTKLMSAPVISLQVVIADPDRDTNQMVPKQLVAFKAAWETNRKKFGADVTKLGTAKVKAVQDAVNWTEEQIAKKSTKAQQDEVVGTANAMLAQAWKVYEYELQKLGQKYFDEAVEKSYQVMKLKLVKAQAKAVAKVVIVTAMALTAVGLSIAATVLTGGLAAPLIVAAVLGGYKAVAGAAKAVDQHWINAEKQIKIVQKDVDTLRGAAGKLQATRRLAEADDAAMDKLERFVAAITGKMVELDKHVGQLDKFVVATSVAVNKQVDELTTLTEQINKWKDADAQKKADKLARDLMLSVGALRAMDDVRVAAGEVKAAWNREQELNIDKLHPALTALGTAAVHLSQVKGGGAALGAVVKKLGG